MPDKNFCPFVNGKCSSECIFYSVSSSNKGYVTNCLIVTAANSLKRIEHIEATLDDIFDVLNTN